MRGQVNLYSVSSKSYFSKIPKTNLCAIDQGYSVFLIFGFFQKEPRGRSDLPVAIFSQKCEKWLKLNNPRY